MRNKSRIVMGGAVFSLCVVGAVVAIKQRRDGAALAPESVPVLNAPVLRTASTHPMQFYVSLPSGWSRARAWPVVVAISGSGKEWLESANGFAAVRDARRYPFIIVTPLVLGNGGRDLRHNPKYTYPSSVWDEVEREGRCPFDREGLRAVLSDVARDYRGEAKAFITGFSGGGHFAVASMLVHPELFRGAALSAANYIGRCVAAPTVESEPDYVEPSRLPPISAAPERATLPVRFFLGSDDPVSRYLGPQRDNAINDARTRGFANISSVTVRSVGHDPMVSRVLDYFSSLLTADER